jgi:hypothetical protein
VLGNSAAVALLQQLAALHSNSSRIGSADPQLVALLLERYIQLEACSLQGRCRKGPGCCLDSALC